MGHVEFISFFLIWLWSRIDIGNKYACINIIYSHIYEPSGLSPSKICFLSLQEKRNEKKCNMHLHHNVKHYVKHKMSLRVRFRVRGFELHRRVQVMLGLPTLKTTAILKRKVSLDYGQRIYKGFACFLPDSNSDKVGFASFRVTHLL